MDVPPVVLSDEVTALLDLGWGPGSLLPSFGIVSKLLASTLEVSVPPKNTGS